MVETIDTFGTAAKNGTVTLLARVVGHDGAPVAPADLAAAEYSVYLLDESDADRREAVAGHAGVPLDVAQLVFDEPQTDSTWTADTIGYNLRHTLDVSEHPAFPVAGRRCLVEFTLTPNGGQVILVRFRLNIV